MSEQEPANQNKETPPLRKRIERAAGRIGLRLVVGPLRSLPLPVTRALGKGLGSLLFHTLGRYRRVALKNLNLVYGNETTEAERLQMARDVFRHFGETAAEFVKMPRLSRAQMDALIDLEGAENIQRALDMGKGVLLISGHFGNWEMMSRWVTTHDYTLSVVARDARDPEATKLLTDTREGGGATVYYRGNAARGILQSLKRNEMVAILPDQNAADVFVPFLGQPTGTVDGPALIHLKTGAPIVFTWCVRTPEDRFHLIFEPPVVVEPTKDRDADIARVMTLINARLEAQIRRYPTQWLWLHNRWKASPGVFPTGAENAVELKTPRKKMQKAVPNHHDADR